MLDINAETFLVSRLDFNDQTVGRDSTTDLDSPPNMIPPISNKATDLIFTRIVVPIGFPTSKPKQNFGQFAIARASSPTVKRPEHQDMPIPRLLREIIRPPALRPTDQRAP